MNFFFGIYDGLCQQTRFFIRLFQNVKRQTLRRFATNTWQLGQLVHQIAQCIGILAVH